MRLWKRRSAAAEARQPEAPPDAAPAEAGGSAPSAFPPAAAPGGHAGGDAAPGPPPGVPSPGAPSPAYGQVPTRTVRGRVLRADSGGAPPAGQTPPAGRTPPAGQKTLPAVTTVTAHRRNGAVVASAVSEDGGYVLDGLPTEPLTLVAVEHPAVHEEVVVRAGDQRHDIALPAFPRKDLR